ncbi:MAG: hypothetical protein JSV38_14695 [Desulfobacterales bacterium]|nr:MAG: hypothetical protein JSV38_14695 [Desulfobacterales bacterium]
MENREIVLNLWYVHDEDGLIYSLRVKVYVAEGSDEDKLAFLQERAQLDYLVAEPFEVPKRFHLKIGDRADSRIMPVSHVSMLDTVDSPISLFEDAIKSIESRMPAQTELDIPENPLVCTTPLSQNEYQVIEPRISGQLNY